MLIILLMYRKAKTIIFMQAMNFNPLPVQRDALRSLV